MQCCSQSLPYLGVFLACCCLVPSCTNVPSVAETKPAPIKLGIQSIVAYRIARSYTDGRTWKIAIVGSKPKRDELIALARYLHLTEPETAFNIFDSDSEVAAYVAWHIDPHRPYPEKWLRAHDLGMINKFLAAGGPTWKLLGGDSLKEDAETELAILN